MAAVYVLGKNGQVLGKKLKCLKLFMGAKSLQDFL